MSMTSDRTTIIFYLMGSIFFLLRMTGGFDYTNPDFIAKIAKVQVCLEIFCVAMLFLQVIPMIVRKFAKTSTMEKAVYLSYIVGCAVIVYFVPSVQDADFTVQKGIFNVMAVVIVFGALLISYAFYERRMKKEHPDGYRFTYKGALTKAMSGTDMESETGILMHVTNEGIVILDDDEPSSIDANDMRCRWRVVDVAD